MQIIKEAETYDRGFYTGIMGYFDGKDLDSAVMIRLWSRRVVKCILRVGVGLPAKVMWKMNIMK